jgi:hypothetical protein
MRHSFVQTFGRPSRGISDQAVRLEGRIAVLARAIRPSSEPVHDRAAHVCGCDPLEQAAHHAPGAVARGDDEGEPMVLRHAAARGHGSTRYGDKASYTADDTLPWELSVGMLANLFRVRHRWLPQGTSCRRARRHRPIRADPAPDPGHHEACTGIPTRRSRVLQWPGVEVGRSDMRVAASGDRADMAMQLAERFHRAPGLTARLRASIPARAPNAQAARDFVRVLLSPAGVDSGLSGQSALQRHGR